MALLRLDAADGHHHRPRGVGVVGALREPLDDVRAGRDLAAGAELDPRPQAGADERVVHGHQPFGQRRADVVGVLHRRRAGPALGAVDDDEVRRGALLEHRLADRQQLAAAADAELEAGGLAAGQLAHARDEADELARRGERRVRGRADARLALRDVARLGDLLRHLAAGQLAADAGLGALAELERDELDVRVRGLVLELLGVEAAVLGARAEVAAAELPDQVAAACEVVLGQPALAGVVGEAAGLRARG